MERPSSTSEATGSVSEGTTQDPGGGGGVLPDCPTAEMMDDYDYSDGCKGGMPIRLVFITSHKYSGALGGLQGADAECNERAKNAGRSGIYKAWLSSSSESASQRMMGSVLAKGLRSLVRTDGVVVAADWSDFVDGWWKAECLAKTSDCLSSKELMRRIRLDEGGDKVAEEDLTFWSGTYPDGGTVAHRGGDRLCGDWTIADAVLHGNVGLSFWGEVGNPMFFGGLWSFGSAEPCNAERRLVCLQWALE